MFPIYSTMFPIFSSMISLDFSRIYYIAHPKMKRCPQKDENWRMRIIEMQLLMYDIIHQIKLIKKLKLDIMNIRSPCDR